MILVPFWCVTLNMWLSILDISDRTHNNMRVSTVPLYCRCGVSPTTSAHCIVNTMHDFQNLQDFCMITCQYTPLRLWDDEIERVFPGNPTSSLMISMLVGDPPNVAYQNLLFSIHTISMPFRYIPSNMLLYTGEFSDRKTTIWLWVSHKFWQEFRWLFSWYLEKEMATFTLL